MKKALLGLEHTKTLDRLLSNSIIIADLSFYECVCRT